MRIQHGDFPCCGKVLDPATPKPLRALEGYSNREALMHMSIKFFGAMIPTQKFHALNFRVGGKGDALSSQHILIILPTPFVASKPCSVEWPP